jgi:hypothetical protein
VTVRAYKVLKEGRSEFTGFRWPLPQADRPGEWLSTSGELGLCVNGIHASSADQLPQWLGDEIWEAELDGEILFTEAALVAGRARLIRLVAEWDGRARLAFCEDCAERARETAERYPQGAEIYTGKIEPFTGRGMAAAVGYWTALLVAEAATGRRGGSDYDEAFVRERSAQAAWLKRELGLA